MPNFFGSRAKFRLDILDKILYDSLSCKAPKLYRGGTDVKNQTYRMTMLFDFYGEVLTPRQKEFFDLYYNEDLSLAEIAENYGITRQGVRDVIVRAEAIMTDLEDKTGLMKRFLQMQQQVQAILDAAEKIQTVNYRQYDNPELARLADEIARSAQALKE